MYRHLTTYYLIIAGLFASTALFAQETETEGTTEAAPFTVEEGATIDLGPEEEDKEVTRKPRRNEFYGHRTVRKVVMRGQGTGLVREDFFILKEYQDPVPFVPDIYWFDFRKDRVVANRNIVPEFAGIMHGPYRRYVGDSLVEEGQYYLGGKHGRWVEYDRFGILQDKQKFFKGWPKESKISYWDGRGQKLREVIPVEYGEENGSYYMFHENGLIAVQGKFKFGHKVGLWREFYSHRRQIKREIQYPTDPFDWDRGYTPVILREYDKRGRLIYDREEYERKLRPRRRG
ncbi:MAG: hypothetical protein AAFQ98_08125 [Bacteroidota bacterium]